MQPPLARFRSLSGQRPVPGRPCLELLPRSIDQPACSLATNVGHTRKHLLAALVMLSWNHPKASSKGFGARCPATIKSSARCLKSGCYPLASQKCYRSCSGNLAETVSRGRGIACPSKPIAPSSLYADRRHSASWRRSPAPCAPEAVEAYKSLAHVKRSFRSLKTAQLAPLLFEEEDRAGARVLRQSPVEKAQVSASTKAKAASKQTPEGLPVHRFQTLLADLGTLTLNEVTLPDAPQHPFPMVAKPTPLQAKAFDLLGVDPGKFVASKLAG